MGTIRCPVSNEVIWKPVQGKDGKESRFLTEFEELKRLGTGGFGCVVECRNILDGVTYAVKKIRLAEEDGLEFKHVIREVHALALMHHVHIARYYSAWVEANIEGIFEEADTEEDEVETGPCLYIQQELCHGSLKKQLEEGELSLDQKWTIFQQILQGLDHIHANQVRHGDLTCGNVLLDKNGNVKIVDFGLASLKERGVLTAGSPKACGVYVAPELKNEGTYSLMPDIYSLGVLLFHIFHKFETEMEKFDAIKKLSKSKTLPKETPFSSTQAQLLRDMIDDVPKLRPTTRMLLALKVETMGKG